MTINEFIEQTVARCAVRKSQDLDNIHAVLGLVTEIEELEVATDRVTILEELGDIAFYACLLLHVNGEKVYEFSGMYNFTTGLSALRTYTANIADDLKRKVYYNKDIDFDSTVAHSASNILSVVQSLAENLGKSLSDVLEINTAKLATRYKNGFIELHANERDLNAERVTLTNAAE